MSCVLSILDCVYVGKCKMYVSKAFGLKVFASFLGFSVQCSLFHGYPLSCEVIACLP